MTKFKNMDSILTDATNVMTIGRLCRSRLPRVADKVVLKTNDGRTMIVEVSWISQDGAVFRGKVAVGDSYPEEEVADIPIGESVEFSLKKIVEVPTKVRRYPRNGQ
jgi:hypothetical protein